MLEDRLSVLLDFDARPEGDGKDVPARVIAAGAPGEVIRAIMKKAGVCQMQ